MGFKEECIKEYEEVKKRSEIAQKERMEKTRERQLKELNSFFLRNFEIELKDEYLDEIVKEYGSFFRVNIDEIKLIVSFSQSIYSPNFHLVIPCRKCNEEMGYNQPVRSKREIGDILENLSKKPDYNCICNKCKDEERTRNYDRRDKEYEEQKEERKKNVVSKLADAIADLLYEAGYPELRNHEEGGEK